MLLKKSGEEFIDQAFQLDMFGNCDDFVTLCSEAGRYLKNVPEAHRPEAERNSFSLGAVTLSSWREASAGGVFFSQQLILIGLTLPQKYLCFYYKHTAWV